VSINPGGGARKSGWKSQRREAHNAPSAVRRPLPVDAPRDSPERASENQTLKGAEIQISVHTSLGELPLTFIRKSRMILKWSSSRRRHSRLLSGPIGRRCVSRLAVVPGGRTGSRRCHTGDRRLSEASMGRHAPRKRQARWSPGDLLPPVRRRSDLVVHALRQG
jgi:hypothetical protein